MRGYCRQAATRAVLQQELAWTNTAHLSCHGVFEADAPPGLRLCLAVLSACQAAIQDFSKLPAEAIGLPAGLLQAGVAGVVAPLWPVDDRSTAMVMVKFYRKYLNTGEPAEALRQARVWLRDATNGELVQFFQRHHELNKARAQRRMRMPNAQIRKGIAEHSVRDPEERPYTDQPYRWAPLVFVGW